MSTLHLLGGGWDPAASAAMYGPFLDAAGSAPVVATLVVDEGDGSDQFARWEQVLTRTAPCRPVPVLVAEGHVLDVGALGDADAVLVCGGLTPAYARALAPVAEQLRTWLADGGRPYAGFSAGAVVAAGGAVVGGWRDAGVAVCPQDAAEDLDEVTVVPGLGLVHWTVDVHCAQWGTLPRLVAAAARTGAGVALDEGTALHLAAAGPVVTGTGSAHCVERREGAVRLTTVRAGGQLPAWVRAG